ncbi:MAG TPA: acyl-CoA dehydrogenase family protein [Spirochaetota bacterium]|nr:acyl-CoA dehydrogenase family protein [Spirochaetota bacterium]HOJ29647.1 acyl-CoA dehydrogenase family protein [Spirochaetota bacterium]HOM10810.1 acyl-CoA dehydrogenase family protein [Spirochaetota bacterium]HPP50657.1 acyl-CoA dehydrogenase family protein [Spirochaetota bacterium]HXK65115.1 acyl-CoA dehydrogenase family protein [Spirochaetota bacterium]
MYDFGLTEEQKLLRQNVREFAEKEILPVAQELDETETFSVELTKKMGSMGLFGIVVPQEYGGAGMDYLSYAIVVEEIARIDGSQAATVAAGNSLGIGPIYYFGNEKQKQEWLPRLCKGEILASFGLTEPEAGSDAGASKTTARLEHGQWVINGSKIFITNSTSPMAGVCTVQAITGKRDNGKKEVSCILVPNGTPGFTAKKMTRKMMWRASDTGELYFDDCKVPEENLLGKRGEGFHQMLSTLDNGRLAIAAMGLGGAQGAYELALKYAKQRKQFGQPISTFQAIAFKLAQMATEIEAARNLLYKACKLKDAGLPFSKHAAMAKLYCSEVMGRVVDQAVQIHGGYGLMKEYNVERFYRDYKLLTIGEGTSEIQKIVISRQIGCYE